VPDGSQKNGGQKDRQRKPRAKIPMAKKSGGQKNRRTAGPAWEASHRIFLPGIFLPSHVPVCLAVRIGENGVGSQLRSRFVQVENDRRN
jgi:hypothetical protein